MAQILRQAVEGLPYVVIDYPVQANALFVACPPI